MSTSPRCRKCTKEVAVNQRGVCKTCWNAYIREYYATHPKYRQRTIEATRQRAKLLGTNGSRSAEAMRRRAKRKNRREQEMRAENNPRIFARKTVEYAVHTGKLAKPDHCSLCKAYYPKRLIHGHHHNGYDEAHWLDVVWLCNMCHQQVHLDR